MSLTASLGFEARNRMVSEIFVYPANRKTDMAVLRNAAMTCGILQARYHLWPNQSILRALERLRKEREK